MDIDLSSLPDSWRKERIKDVVEFTKKPRGFVISNSYIYFLPMELLPISRLFAEQFEERPAVQLGSGTYIEDGDLLVAKITPCFENGKQAIAKIGYPFAFATTEVIPLKGRPNLINTLFLHYVLLHPGIRKKLASQMDGSTNRQRLGKGVLEENVIPVPPLNEQCKISEILFSLQRAIEQQERLIFLTTELKKALMNKLFTEGTRGEPQKQTEIGPVPESWEVKPLSELVKTTQNVDMRIESMREIRYVDVSSVSRKLLRIESSETYVLKDAPSRARKKISFGDVLFATVRPTLLRVAWIGNDYANEVCSTAFCVLRDKNTATSGRFIYYLVQRDQFIKQLAAIESGANYPAVTDRQIKKQLVPVPSDEEQFNIAQVLAVCDDKISVHERMFHSYSHLFRSLLHKLMTAEIRVNDLDLSEIGIEDLRTG